MNFSILSGLGPINNAVVSGVDGSLETIISNLNTSTQLIFAQPFSLDEQPETEGSVSVNPPATVSIGTHLTILAKDLILIDPLPDIKLEADNIEIKAQPTEGDKVDVYAVVPNNGDVAADGFTVSFYDGDPENGGRLIGVDMVAPGLQPGESGVAHVLWDTGGYSNTVDIYVRIDPFNRLSENDKTNNIAFTPVDILSKAALHISSDNIDFSIPNPETGQQVTISATIYNQGETAALNTSIDCYLGDPSSGGELIGSNTTDIPGLDSIISEISWTPDVAGVFDIYLVVNESEEIAERDYSDNIAIKPITVSPSSYYLDSGRAESDIEYSEEQGCGFLDGFPFADWGEEPYQNVRIDFDGEINYRFDNLDLSKHYHLDFCFYEGDQASRIGEIWVDGTRIGESIALGSVPIYPSFTVPADTYSDETIDVSIMNAGTGTMVVSEIRLISIQKTYIDCGAVDDLAYDSDRGYGYLDGQAFTNWGAEPYQTVRLDMDGEVGYRFDSLQSDKAYQLFFTFFEGDSGGRSQEIYIDDVNTNVNVDLSGAVAVYESADVDTAQFETDSSIVVHIRKTAGIGAMISELTLEEKTTLRPTVIVLGDMNGDGIANLDDVSVILNILTNTDQPVTYSKQSEPSENDKIDLEDSAILLRDATGR